MKEHIKALEELAEFPEHGDTGTGGYVEDRLKSIPPVLAELKRLMSESPGPSWQNKPFQDSKGGWYWIKSPNGISFEFVTPGRWPAVITQIAGPVEADDVATQTPPHALACKQLDDEGYL